MFLVLSLSILLNILITVYALQVQRGSFGVLGHVPGTFILRSLEFFQITVAVISFDMRKVHELILALGYENTTLLIRSFLKMRYGRSDFVFQKGGDEFVAFIVMPGPSTAENIVRRMQANMAMLTSKLSQQQRARMYALTGGLVDSLSASIVYVPSTRRAYTASRLAMDIVNEQKVGNETTRTRATCGKAGTVIGRLDDNDYVFVTAKS